MATQSFNSCVLFGTIVLISSSLMPLAMASSRRELQSINQQFLVPQNQLRASLGLPPLQWSTKLATYAAWWASQRSGDCELLHSDNNYGENIFWGGGSGWQAADAVRMWAEERNYYNYASNSCQPDHDCSHYTQIVWRQTSRLGCARVVCNNNLGTFITCNYDPHGNVQGQKPF